ncbi:hypothetical protein JTB14_010062 [Gonioctena quinquepunctata]|nr:hypothetical protein JTB14_010062 [Gonioctena quinquepunctata]
MKQNKVQSDRDSQFVEYRHRQLLLGKRCESLSALDWYVRYRVTFFYRSGHLSDIYLTSFIFGKLNSYSETLLDHDHDHDHKDKTFDY